MKGNIQFPPSTPLGIGLSITQAMTPGSKSLAGAFWRLGVGIPVSRKEILTIFYYLEITLDNIKKQVYITIQ